MLSLGNLCLPNPLGWFIGTPHVGGDWIVVMKLEIKFVGR